MNKGLSIFVSLALGLSTVVSAQSAPTKVGIINIQAALVSTKEGQKAASELEGRAAPKKKELEKRQSDLQSLRDQLAKLGNAGSEEAKQKLMREIDQKTKSYNRDIEDAQAELDQEQQKILNDLGGRMMQVLDKYAKDNGYAIILDVSNQNTPVLFASNSVDVTQEIIKLYDTNAPAPSSSAPATSTVAPASVKPGGTSMPKPTAITPVPRPPATAPKK